MVLTGGGVERILFITSYNKIDVLNICSKRISVVGYSMYGITCHCIYYQRGVGVDDIYSPRLSRNIYQTLVQECWF